MSKPNLLIASTIFVLVFGTGSAMSADTEPPPNSGNPHDALLLIEEGDRQFHADNLSEAITNYRKAVHSAPLNATAHERLARALSLNDNLTEAEQEAKQAVTLDGKNSLAHTWYGWILGRQGKYKAALAEETIAVDLDENNAFAYQTMGLILTSTGDYSQAIKAYERAIKHDPYDLGSYLNMAAAMGRKGDYAGAASVYRKAISLNKRSALAHLGLGSALGKIGDRDGQVRELQTAVALSPKSANAHGRLGFAYSQKKDFRGAMREGIVASVLRLENSWSTFMRAMITTWAAVFLVFGAVFAFVFFGSRFKAQPGEEVLKSYFLVFHKERPGRFVITSRRLVYVPEAVSQWFGSTRLSIEREQVEKVVATSSVSGGAISIATKDGATHKFSMPNLVLDPLSRKLDSLDLGTSTDLVSA
ncbi:MAG TPA: tetratricopeptide repeat protein [Candidatus Melainabacteria bacterium]|nr:tetratricopeptide repeat protein [Candidatus Melainabacteria bacterium]